MVVTRIEAFRILEISEQANEDTIRKAYKKLALKYHPDKNQNSQQSTHKFQQISEAYKCLTDPSYNDENKDFSEDMTEEDMFELFSTMFEGLNVNQFFEQSNQFGKESNDFNVASFFMEQMDDFNKMPSDEDLEDFEDFMKQPFMSDQFASSPLDEFMSMPMSSLLFSLNLEDDVDDLPPDLLSQMRGCTMNKKSTPVKSRARKTGKNSKKSRSVHNEEEKPHDENTKNDHELLVNSRVIVHGKYIGTVKFIGETHYAKGTFIGVELDEPNGKNNGTIKGVEYFTCPNKCGLMVRSNDAKRIHISCR